MVLLRACLAFWLLLSCVPAAVGVAVDGTRRLCLAACTGCCAMAMAMVLCGDRDDDDGVGGGRSRVIGQMGRRARALFLQKKAIWALFPPMKKRRERDKKKSKH